MAESTLNVAYKEIQAEVGDYLGYGRGANYGETAWTTARLNRINACLKEGLRMFYYPPADAGGPYNWTFLKPLVTASLASGATRVELPTDFGGIESPVHIISSTQNVPWEIEITGIGKVEYAFALQPTRTGKPQMAALEPIKGTTNLTSSRWQLYVFPTADAAYTLRFQYSVYPDFLSGAHPYAYGGAEHASTILAACKAAAEVDVDDVYAARMAKFKERLASSIASDRNNLPQLFGYNDDRSDNTRWNRRMLHGQSLVTVYGVQY